MQNDLLAQIQKGKKLNKTSTVDKSAPILAPSSSRAPPAKASTPQFKLPAPTAPRQPPKPPAIPDPTREKAPPIHRCTLF